MLIMVLAPLASAADSDGDGFENSIDDCPWAAGLSNIDRDGCPDRDGDGTSDLDRRLDNFKPEFPKRIHNE